MEIIKKEESETLSVRLFTSVKDLPKNLGEIYGEVSGIFGKNGISCAGAPFVIYYNMDMENLDIEAGFPVSGALEDKGRVKCSKLPGGEQALAVHKGSYDRLGETYEKLSSFCAENGREAREDCMYEEYLNSPEDCKPEELLTNLYFLLK